MFDLHSTRGRSACASHDKQQREAIMLLIHTIMFPTELLISQSATLLSHDAVSNLTMTCMHALSAKQDMM